MGFSKGGKNREEWQLVSTRKKTFLWAFFIQRAGWKEHQMKKRWNFHLLLLQLFSFLHSQRRREKKKGARNKEKFLASSVDSSPLSYKLQTFLNNSVNTFYWLEIYFVLTRQSLKKKSELKPLPFFTSWKLNFSPTSFFPKRTLVSSNFTKHCIVVQWVRNPKRVGEVVRKWNTHMKLSSLKRGMLKNSFRG